jgi:hypothetical protein
MPLQKYHVITMPTPLLQQPEFTGLLQVSNVSDNQEQWPFQDFNVPLTQRAMTVVRIISARDTSFTEEARHNDTHLKRALSSTTAPNTRVSVSIVPSTVYYTKQSPLYRTDSIIQNSPFYRTWSIVPRFGAFTKGINLLLAGLTSNPLLSHQVPPTSFLVRAPVFVRSDSMGVLARCHFDGSADWHRRQQLAFCRGTSLVGPQKQGVVVVGGEGGRGGDSSSSNSSGRRVARAAGSTAGATSSDGDSRDRSDGKTQLEYQTLAKSSDETAA